jgi:serine phosphatase RsbU (regulator of sigma subunit)
MSGNEATDARSLALGPGAESVPVARHWVRAQVRELDAEALVDDVEMVVSELVANVVLHAPGPAVLTLVPEEDGLRLEVADTGAAMPTRRLATDSGTTGRGLNLVSSLTEGWGVLPRGDELPGKVVWCRFGRTAQLIELDLDPEALLAAFDDDAAIGFEVTVGEAPTELVAAAKDHLDGLLREFALAEGAVNGALPTEVVESITSAVSRFAEARSQLRRLITRAAAEDRHRVLVRFSLPADLADAGEDYLDALARADSHARDRRLLSLESPAAYRVLREWYVRALVDGLRCAAAGIPAPEVPSFEQYLLAELQLQEERARESALAAQLQRVTARLAGAQTLTEITEIAVTEGLLALGAAGGSLTRPTPGLPSLVLELGIDVGLGDRIHAAGGSPMGPSREAMLTATPVFIGGREERDSRFPVIGELQPDALALASVPLTVADQVVGALRFTWTSPRLFTEPERDYLSGLAAQAAQAVGRTDALSRLQEAESRSDRALERLRLLNDVGADLTATLDVDEALTRLAHRMVPVLGDLVSVDLRDEDDNVGVRGVVITAADPERATAMRSAEQVLPRRHNPGSAVHRVLRGEPLVRVEVLPGYLAGVAVDDAQLATYEAIDMRFATVVPLQARGRVFGVLSLIRTGPDARRYTEEEEQLALEIGRRAGLIVDNAAQYNAQRTVAEGLQRSLLPELPSPPGLRLGAVYEPSSTAAKVGGDWYDAFPLPDGSLGLVIGDVMGHDIAAAAAMGQLRSVLRTCAVDGDEPALVLDRLDRLVTTFAMADLATVVYARVTRMPDGSAQLAWSNAGHPPPLLLAPGQPARYLTGGASTMIGVEVGAPRVPSFEVLPAGATLLMYTDGLVERRDADLDVGLERVRATAEELLALVSGPEELCSQLIGAVRRGSSDDVAVVALTLDP